MTTKPSTRREQVTKLPPPVPGQEVTIPLELWPLYQQAHRIEVMSRGEVREWEKRTGQYKPDGIVMVKRLEG